MAIPVAPNKKKSKPSTGGGTKKSSSSGSSKSSSSGGGGGGSSKKPSDPYLAAQQAAQRKADKKEAEAKRKASNKYIKAADTLQEQADALKIALGKSGFRRQLNIKLGNISTAQSQADDLLMKNFNERLADLRGTQQDNEKSAASEAQAGLSNRGRERANALSQAMLQGAGESDVLAAQQMALRNWEANTNETVRNYLDSTRSVNSSIGDLNADTRTARVNNAVQANADREQLWTNYYNQVSDAYTQLGNIKGQQANYLGEAFEQVASKKTRRKQARYENFSGDWYDAASRAQGKAYKNPGVSGGLRNWKGGADEKPEKFAQRPVSAAIFSQGRTPEGASLRKW